ncbi:MAG: response regulator transcription factor [Actinomycetota bacterium]
MDGGVDGGVDSGSDIGGGSAPRSHVLVVEDEVGIADALQRGLTADGFDVDVARTGPDGLALARRLHLDLIVLDLMLPGLSGEALCRTLRDDGDDVPILMLTAKDTDEQMVTGLGLGADDYLVKPFSYVVLRSRVNALIRRTARATRPTATDPIRVGDLTVEPDRRRVVRGDTVVDLSPRMFDALSHLATNAGTVVSKRQLLDAVWGSAFAGDDNVVEVTISRLRQAIDAPFDRRTLQTVRGLGYRLRDDHS